MKCVVCKSPDIERKRVDEEIKFKKDIILVPVEVLVCNNCGERYYDSKTMRELENMKVRINKEDLAYERVGEVLRAKVA
jgi:YgiT-type zinc finger domain-containing protein